MEIDKTAATAPTAEPTAAPTTQAGTGDNEPKKEKVVFSPEQQEHVDKLIAAQYAKVMAKADKKFAELQQSAQEAEKLKNMSAEDRTKAELEKAHAKIQEYERQQLVSQFKVELTEKGLPAAFAEHIPVKDADGAKAAVDFLTKYKADVSKGYEDKIKQLEENLRNASIRGEPPKAVGGNPPPSGMSPMGAFMIDKARKSLN